MVLEQSKYRKYEHIAIGTTRNRVAELSSVSFFSFVLEIAHHHFSSIVVDASYPTILSIKSTNHYIELLLANYILVVVKQFNRAKLIFIQIILHIILNRCVVGGFTSMSFVFLRKGKYGSSYNVL